jgi:light-regulated signal transduction histidine kinase (bacteriophytochrome)
MGQESLKRISVPVDDGIAPESPSDVWVVPRTPYDHMIKVARDARNLLGALNANVDWLKSGFADGVPTDSLVEGLDDIETCCERLTSLLEDALVGTRKQGLSVERSILSIGSVLAAALKKVKKSTESKRVSFDVATECDVVAMFDRTLLTRAISKLMGRIVAEVEPDAKVSVRYRLQDEQIQVTFARSDSALRTLRPSHTSLRPGMASGPSRRDADDSELEFCHVVAEAHGGALTRGSALTLYCIVLPWVGPEVEQG